MEHLVDEARIRAAAASVERTREQLRALAASIADTEEYLASTFEQAAQMRPHAAERLLSVAEEARRFAAEEREREVAI